MKIKTSELSDAALDWAVAKCAGQPVYYNAADTALYMGFGPTGDYPYAPSTDWSQAGPLIDGGKVGVWWEAGPYADNVGPCWFSESAAAVGCGPTPLIAAMRCYVASKLGDEVEVPDVLKMVEV